MRNFIKDWYAGFFLKNLGKKIHNKKPFQHPLFEKNTPLHLALLYENHPLIKELIKNSQNIHQKNVYGMTPLDLARIWKRKSYETYFPLERPLTINLEKKGKSFLLTKKQFEEEMEIDYLFDLELGSLSTFFSVVSRCHKTEKKHEISREQKWLSFYFSQELDNPVFPDLTIKWVDNFLGYGLFTNRDLLSNTFIGEYTGVLRKSKKRVDEKNSYCFEYLIGGIETPFLIDAKEKGNFTRFINHSSHPNLRPAYVYKNGIIHLILQTNQPVKKGSELTYDYGPNYWKKREKPIEN
jgi:hypothetical protein